MEGQKSTTKSIMLNYGLVLGFISILLNVINFAFGSVYEPHIIMTIVGIVVPIAFYVLGLKKVKEANDGYLGLGEAIKVGLGIALVSAIVFLVYFLIFTSFIEPEFYARTLELREAQIIEKYPNFTDEQLEAAMGLQRKINTPGILLPLMVIMSLFFGFIIALIAGAIMKKSKEE